MSERTTQLKERAISELKKYSVIVAYLWALFALFQLHKLVILRVEDPLTTVGYTVGFALINALILGKIILIAEIFRVGEHFKDKSLVYSILFKSAVFSLLLVLCNILEEVLIGLFHHKTISESIPVLGGGGLEGILIIGAVVFIALIPFFLFEELARAIGEEKLVSMLFKRRMS